MRILKLYFLIIIYLFLANNNSILAQGSDCTSPDPFCSGSTTTFPAGVNNGDAMTTAPTNNYGCLGSAPNPAWYFFQIDQPGNLTIDMSNSNNVDIDFILWGPYPDYNTAVNSCGNLGAAGSGTSPNSVIDCSYSASATETANINNAQNGDVYILLITNFSNSPTNISFTNSGGTATTNCNIVTCAITNITTSPGPCDPATNTYSTTGSVTFSDPPTTGNLIVEDCNGNQDVIPPPFNSPMNYTINNQTADGNPCTITAYFSDNPTCSLTSPSYNAPASCLTSCPVQITDTIYSHISCNGANDGSIQIIATGGATQSSIDNGATWQATNTFTGLAPGTYVCVADDGAGCQDFATVVLNEPLPLSIPNSKNNVSCNSACDGMITVTPQGGTSPYTYSWTNVATTASITSLCAGTYTITVTDANGCTLDSTFNITEPQALSIPKTITDASCFGVCDGSIVVAPQGGTQPYAYSWSNGATTPNISALCAGTYTVTVTDDNGCTLDSTFTINEPPQVTFTTTTTDASCFGVCDGSATVQGSDPNITYAYQWDAGAGSATTPTVSNLCVGNYYCIVSDANTGCFDTAFVTINEPPQISLTTSSDTTICVGTSATISALASGGTAPYTYTWSNGVTGSSQTVSPTGNTVYSVVATDANGCNSASHNVAVSLYPVLNLSVTPTQYVCPGQSTVISATVSGGNGGPYSYMWSNGSTSSSQTVSPTSTTTYYVTATDNCSPAVMDSVLVNVFDLPVITFTADTFAGCEPLTVTFYNTSNNTSNPVWNFGDGSTASGDTIMHTYMNNGVYDVQLSVTGTGGCVDSLNQQNFITVYNTPIADFYYVPDSIDMLNTRVEFYDNSFGNNINYWAWNFNYWDSSFAQNPVYTFPEDTGTYYVSLYVEDANGCKDSTFKFIRITGVYTIYVPNAFTPTDTKNLNDYFRPQGIGISDKDYSFYIFNRWGNLIYESHDFKGDEGWDGTYKGELVPLDVYVWKLQFKDINGKHHVLHGHVTIVK